MKKKILLVFLIFFFIIILGKINKYPYYLSFRSLVINMIEISKNTNIFKYPFIKYGTYIAKKNYDEKNIIKKRILINEKYLLNLDQLYFFKQNNLVELLSSNEIFPSNITIGRLERLKEVVPFNKNKPELNSEIIGVNYYNINHYGIIERNAVNGKNLLIYIQGHKGNPYNFDYFIKLKNKFKGKGYDVLSLSMTGTGFNYNKNVNFPGIKSTNSEDHSTYADFLDNKSPNKKPLSLMISGNYYLVKEVLKTRKYEKILIVGMSGGGWNATILSSIIPEIKTTYNYSGSVPRFLGYLEISGHGPRFLGFFKDTAGDFEQIGEFYKSISYWDLFYLSSIDRSGKLSRKNRLIYNINDKCCFKDPSASIMKEISEKLGNKYFQVIKIDDGKNHRIDENLIIKDYFTK